MAVFTTLPNKAIGNPLYFQDWNEGKENSIYLKDQLEVEHDDTTGFHNNVIRHGEGTDSDKELEFQTADAAGQKPEFRYNSANECIEFRAKGAGNLYRPIHKLKDLGTVSGSQALNFREATEFLITLGGALTLSAPTNVVPGMVVTLIIVQSYGGGNTVTLNSVFKTVGGAGFTLSAGANDIDILKVHCKSSTELLTEIVGQNFS